MDGGPWRHSHLRAACSRPATTCTSRQCGLWATSLATRPSSAMLAAGAMQPLLALLTADSKTGVLSNACDSIGGICTTYCPKTTSWLFFTQMSRFQSLSQTSITYPWQHMPTKDSSWLTNSSTASAGVVVAVVVGSWCVLAMPVLSAELPPSIRRVESAQLGPPTASVDPSPERATAQPNSQL